jgi:hypothetical protein
MMECLPLLDGLDALEGMDEASETLPLSSGDGLAEGEPKGESIGTTDSMLSSGDGLVGGEPSRPVPQLQQLSKLSSHSSLHFGHFHMACPFGVCVVA